MQYDGLLFHELPVEERERIIHNAKISFKELDEYLNDKIEAYNWSQYRYIQRKSDKDPENELLRQKVKDLHDNALNLSKPQGYYKDRSITQYR